MCLSLYPKCFVLILWDHTKMSRLFLFFFLNQVKMRLDVYIRISSKKEHLIFSHLSLWHEIFTHYRYLKRCSDASKVMCGLKLVTRGWLVTWDRSLSSTLPGLRFLKQAAIQPESQASGLKSDLKSLRLIFTTW